MKHYMYGIVLAGSILALTGCTQATQYALEAGEASKSYVDEVTDRREDLRSLKYQVEDSMIDMHMRAARQAADNGEFDKAAEQYQKVIERIDDYYPDLGELRERVSKLREEVAQ